jgi:hypothetical protein
MKSLKLHLLATLCVLASLCSPAWAATNLPFGQVVTGTVTSSSSIALPSKYSFNANTGDLVNFTLIATSGSLVPEIQLYNSTGGLIASNNAGSPFGCNGTAVQMNSVQLTASVGGTYNVWVTDCNGANGGNYSLYAQRTNNPGGTVLPLPFGSEETGAISAVAQSNTYTFTANANDEINFTLDTISGSLVPAIQLYNPNGTLLHANNAGSPFGCSGANVEMNTVQIPTTGSYTVLINDCNQVNSGDYEIYVQRTDAPGGTIVPLLFDAVQTGTISTETQSNTYTFTAKANDVLNFTLDTTSGSLVPAIQLYNPNGTLLTSNNAGSPFGCSGTNVEMNTVTLPSSGTYTVLINDCNTTNSGSYAIFTQRTNNPTGPVNLPFGQAVTGLVGSVTQSVPYTFSANAGDVFDFTLMTTNGSLIPAIQLYNINGSLLSSNNSGSPFGCSGGGLELNTVTIPATGTYTVLIDDCNTTNTGNYALYVQRTNNPTGAAAVLWGQVQTGTVGAVAQSTTYTFAGTAGDVIDLTMTGTTSGGSLIPKIRLYNPNGSLNSSNNSGSPFGCSGTTVGLSSITLGTTGNYTVLLGDCNDTNTGNFSLSGQCFGTCLLPAPILASLSETSALEGSGGFTLTVNGSNFVNENASSVVDWNGSPLTTTWISTNQMTAAVPAANIATAGVFQVTVFTPAPGGGTSSAILFTVNNPVPTLTSLSSTSTTAPGAAFTLTLTGANFVQSSSVQWNGNSLATTYVNATQLTAAVPASDLAVAGTASVAVFNPTPGGGTSTAQTFTIDNPVPGLTSILPTSAIAGSGAFTLTVNGSNFVSGSVVKWNASSLATTYVSATELTAQVPAADIATAGTASVTVFNATPGGGTTTAQTFTVDNPVPTLTSLSSTSTTAPGAAFTLTLTGTNFVQSSSVQWNGNSLATTYVSATQLKAAVAASDISVAGTASVTVFNPTPGGGTSAAQTFTINDPVPGITSISPSSVVTGSGAFTLTVNGSNFVHASVVQWNGNTLVTTYVSATQLTAQVPAAWIPTVGSLPVNVWNPAPAGGGSNSETFSILQYAASPTFSVAAGTYSSTFLVTLSDTTPGSVIHYAINGVPTANSAVYSAPIDVASTMTVEAIAVASGYAQSALASATYTINFPATQAIAFPAITGTQFALSQLPLTATATSGLAVSFSSATPAVCSVSGTTASLLTAGTCVLHASQAGNSDYSAAPTVAQSFAVHAVPQTMTFPAISGTQYALSQLTLSATASSGLAVSFSSTTPTVCTVSGSTVSLLIAGTCVLHAAQAGNSVYAVAPAVTQSFAVHLIAQTMTFPAITQTPFALAQITLVATATSGLPVTITSTTPTVCTVSGFTASLLVPGTCVLHAAQAGNSDYSPAPALAQDFTVVKAQQDITFPAITGTQHALSSVTLTATASSGLAVSYTSTTPAVCTVSGSTAQLLIAGTCVVHATQAGNSVYDAASMVAQSFAVHLISQTITFPAITGTQSAGTQLTLTATATSGLPVTYTSTTTAVCTVSGSTASLLTAGTCILHAAQTGNSDYAAAPTLAQSFAVKAAAVN